MQENSKIPTIPAIFYIITLTGNLKVKVSYLCYQVDIVPSNIVCEDEQNMAITCIKTQCSGLKVFTGQNTKQNLIGKVLLMCPCK